MPVPTVQVALPPPLPAPQRPRPVQAEDTEENLLGLVCHGREGCSVKKTHDAGKDSAGRALRVVLVSTGGRLPEDATDDPPCPEGETSCENVSYQPDGEIFDARSFGSCAVYEYWLTVQDGAEIVACERIDDVCNEGHGAAGIGEDSIKIGPNSFEHDMSGGSAWRWSEVRRLSLSPFRLLGTERQGFWTNGPNEEESKVDWTTLEASARWFSPVCDENGDPPTLPEDFTPDEDTEHAYVPIPLVPLDEAFRTSGWKTTRLGHCAAAIDASVERGYLLSGKASSAEDASLRVLATGAGELFVEVRDDHFVGPTAAASSDDRLEVWAAGPLPDYSEHCLEPKKAGAMQSWNVRVADGKVTAGFGKPKPSALTAERAAGTDGAVRFHLVVPPPVGSITIAYADNDGGKKIVRRIATSRVKQGNAASLGGFLAASGFASCTATGGELTVEVAPLPFPK